MMERLQLYLIIFIFGIFTICSCKTHAVKTNYEELYNTQININNDVINQNLKLNDIVLELKDSLNLYKNSDIKENTKINDLRDSISILKDSVNFYKEDGLVAKYKLERIKAYDKIVRNNSSQSKWFIGWVRRVLED
jgi:hypothetical protein